MKTTSFKLYLKKRLNQEEVQEIEQQVDSEFNALKSLQQDISIFTKNKKE